MGGHNYAKIKKEKKKNYLKKTKNKKKQGDWGYREFIKKFTSEEKRFENKDWRTAKGWTL